eukprot:345483-Chlamydomonas_euryale.AAC.4
MKVEENEHMDLPPICFMGGRCIRCKGHTDVYRISSLHTPCPSYCAQACVPGDGTDAMTHVHDGSRNASPPHKEPTPHRPPLC